MKKIGELNTDTRTEAVKIIMDLQQSKNITICQHMVKLKSQKG